jgi:hypothetical protein
MARIREFDIDIALKVAMKLFWRKVSHLKTSTWQIKLGG